MVIFEIKKNWISLFTVMTLDVIKDRKKVINHDDVHSCDQKNIVATTDIDIKH